MSAAERAILVLDVDDAPRLAHLHASSFDRPWDEDMFRASLALPTTLGLASGDAGIGFQAFILVSTVPPEAEILTVATAPNARRQGLAGHLLSATLMHLGQQGLETLFLEVAVSNRSARKLYQSFGFVERGKRSNYYRNPSGSREDALILGRPVSGQ